MGEGRAWLRTNSSTTSCWCRLRWIKTRCGQPISVLLRSPTSLFAAVLMQIAVAASVTITSAAIATGLPPVSTGTHFMLAPGLRVTCDDSAASVLGPFSSETHREKSAIRTLAEARQRFCAPTKTGTLTENRMPVADCRRGTVRSLHWARLPHKRCPLS